MKLSEALFLMFEAAVERDVSISLEFETGRYVEGKDIDPNDPLNVDESKIKQGPKGFRVEVAGRSYSDQNGNQLLYKTLDEAVLAGIKLLAMFPKGKVN